MAENSKIEWTDHTFNPWIGCAKVSDGCKHCYAETLMHRYGKVKWGPQGTRQRTSEANWRKPLQWNRQAEKEGRRYRVFCASLADVFEDRPELVEWRNDLLGLIEDTPNLDWLLLTKRPENINRMIADLRGDCEWLSWNGAKERHNIWIGTSVEDQKAADERIPHLLNIPARVRFLSCEPLLGPVDLGMIRTGRNYDCPPEGNESYDPLGNIYDGDEIVGISFEPGIHWVIAGGESGPKARPMHPEWARSLRDQCQDAGVPFLFKQWGEFAPQIVFPPSMASGKLEFPEKEILTRVGKKTAGRLLDGREWNEFPLTQKVAQ